MGENKRVCVLTCSSAFGWPCGRHEGLPALGQLTGYCLPLPGEPPVCLVPMRKGVFAERVAVPCEDRLSLVSGQKTDTP